MRMTADGIWGLTESGDRCYPVEGRFLMIMTEQHETPMGDYEDCALRQVYESTVVEDVYDAGRYEERAVTIWVFERRHGTY